MHCPSTVTKHFPDGGGRHEGTHSWLAGHGAVGEHEPLHCAVVGSRQIPVGSGGGHSRTQISAWRPTKAPVAEEHGWTGEHDAPHCPVDGLKHVPVGSGGGHCGTQNSFGGQGWSGPHDWPVHCRLSVSKHVPLGGGGAQRGLQNSFGMPQGMLGLHAWSVHRIAIVSKQSPMKFP